MGRVKCTRNMQLLRADSDSVRSVMTCHVWNFQPADVVVRCRSCHAIATRRYVWLRVRV